MSQYNIIYYIITGQVNTIVQIVFTVRHDGGGVLHDCTFIGKCCLNFSSSLHAGPAIINYA